MYQNLYTGKKCGDLFSYLMNFPADHLKKNSIFALW